MSVLHSIGTKLEYYIIPDMCGSTMVLDNDMDHPAAFTFDDTKNDGTFPCIVGYDF